MKDSSEPYDIVWDAIENTPTESENLRIRATLTGVITEYIRREELTQSAAAKLFGVTQPRISDLVRGKIDLFSIDSLVNMLATAHLRVEIKVA